MGRVQYYSLRFALLRTVLLQAAGSVQTRMSSPKMVIQTEENGVQMQVTAGTAGKLQDPHGFR